MKVNDIVILTNFKNEYKDKNLYQNVNGVVLKLETYEKSLVLFLNDKIMGDYAVVKIDNIDIKKADIKLPIDFILKLKKLNRLSEENLYKKTIF